ncbi:MAG: recombinase family protein [Chloroflexi bacterium]|nr:recombinase family protein [Chloroflexota bacterium]
MVTILRAATRQALTFEDLKGLRAEGYVRDSTLDQRDGFGPDIQHRNEERFAQSYGLVLGSRWYTEFVSGRSASKRQEFQQVLEDARLDRFDVLLVDHTSRFGRNQAECIRYKAELQRLGKTVVFVSQGIISGSDRDFLAERINETLDEQYSRNLSRYVAAGLAEKASQGLANGVPPLGYKSEKLDNGKRERKVPDPDTTPALLALLRGYASGQHSYRTLADWLNAQGYRNREGEPFSTGSVEHVLSNRFYAGKAVYHPGEPDEEVRGGAHEVPAEVKELWLRCQEIKAQQRRTRVGAPRRRPRAYPFSRLAFCAGCGGRFTGKPARTTQGDESLRLVVPHARCDLQPHSVRVDYLEAQWREGVLPYLTLDDGWQRGIAQALQDEAGPSNEKDCRRLESALANLRKQHLWGDISDEDYRRDRDVLERQLKALAPPGAKVHLPNLERAAGLLNDLPALWAHPGVSNEQREALGQELLERAIISGGTLVAIEPRAAYRPLFGYLANQWKNCLPKPTRPDDIGLKLPLPIA